MPILSAAQASFAVRCETMDTMVCSIFSGAKSDVCASMDLLRALLNLETGAVICSLLAEMIPVSGAVVVVVVVVGSVVRGWKVVAFFGIGLVVVVGPAETTPGDGVSPAKGPGANVPSGKLRGKSVRKVSPVSEAEPGFPEIGDASLGLMRGAASENPIYTYKINSRTGDMYIIKDVNLIFSFSSPCKPQ